MKLKKALIASCCLVGSLISIAGDLLTYEFDDVVLTPTEVTNLVMDIGVGSNMLARIASNIIDKAGALDTNAVIDLIHSTTGGLDTNAVESISSYTVSNTVAAVALTGNYADLAGTPEDTALSVVSNIVNDALLDKETTFSSILQATEDALESVSNAVRDADGEFMQWIDAAMTNLADTVHFTEEAKEDIAVRVIAERANISNSVSIVREELNDRFIAGMNDYIEQTYETAVPVYNKHIVSFYVDDGPEPLSYYGARYPNAYWHAGSTNYLRHSKSRIDIEVMDAYRNSIEDLLDVDTLPDDVERSNMCPCYVSIYEYNESGQQYVQAERFESQLIYLGKDGSFITAGETVSVQTNGIDTSGFVDVDVKSMKFDMRCTDVRKWIAVNAPVFCKYSTGDRFSREVTDIDSPGNGWQFASNNNGIYLMFPVSDSAFDDPEAYDNRLNFLNAMGSPGHSTTSDYFSYFLWYGWNNKNVPLTTSNNSQPLNGTVSYYFGEGRSSVSSSELIAKYLVPGPIPAIPFPTNVIRDIVYDIITNEFGLTAQ